MNSNHPLIESLSDHQVEEWFAAAGVSARVVEGCPQPGCAVCASAAADLASAA